MRKSTASQAEHAVPALAALPRSILCTIGQLPPRGAGLAMRTGRNDPAGIIKSKLGKT
jgi:hypothetical protein